MSRLGKKPILVPANVKFAVNGRTVNVEGPKGKLQWEHRSEVKVNFDEAKKQITVDRVNDERPARAYGADAVVYDGSDPPQALIAAVGSRSRCKLAWIRRGMWEPGYDPSLHLSPHFDLILEPGELAAARDRGATALRRN